MPMLKHTCKAAMVVHACNPSTGEVMAGGSSLRLTWVTQQDPVSKTEHKCKQTTMEGVEWQL
jgi:hypothetical protein